jgi:hypothetical protein
MSRRNYFFPALVLGTLLFASRAEADETLPGASAPATNRPAFNASLRGGETIGERQVQRAFLTLGNTQIAFVIPTDFSMDASDSQKIVLSDNAGRYFITLRIHPSSGMPADSSPDSFKIQALSRFPGAKISSESSENAASHSGPAFNLDWLSPNGGRESARIAFIPCPGGILEFSVLSRSASFKDAQLYLTVLLSSVRTNESGKLVIVPLPGVS